MNERNKHSSGLRRILYVEDDPDIRTVAELSLETLGGFELLLCESGEQAVAGAEAFQPDLILLDVMMPGMDGPATLTALRNIDSIATLPFVFMTAKVQAAEINEYKAMGAADVIPKPFDPMTLPDQIFAIWRKARNVRE
jgi:CheY-like chemotaxis protein